MRVADLEAATGAASAAHAPASAHGAGEWSAARWFDTLGATEAVTRSVLPPGTTDELQAIRSLASDSDLNAELLRRLIGGLPALAKTLKAAITELAARESATAGAVGVQVATKSKERPQQHAREWNASAWLGSLPLPALVASAMESDGQCTFEAMKALTREDLRSRLDKAGLRGLTETVWAGVEALKQQKQASSKRQPV